MTDTYVPGAVSSILAGSPAKSKESGNNRLAALFSPSPTDPPKKKAKLLKKSSVLDESLQVSESENNEQQNLKKMKRKKVELIDQLEGQYEEKKAKLQGGGKSTPSKTDSSEKVKEFPRPRRDRKKRNPDQEGRTLFVGNLPIDVTKKTLKKLFKKYGEVESIRFRSAAPADLKLPRKAIVAMKAFHENRHSINCYVVFKEESMAKEALQENGTEVKGLHIRVDLATKTTQHQHSNTVFIGNLPFDVEEEPLRNHFEDCGEIENVRLIRDRKTQLGKGFGYVLFKDKASVELALKLNGESCCGRKLRVTRSLKNPTGAPDKDKKRGKKTSSKVKRTEKTTNVQETFQGTKAEKLQKIKKKNKFKRTDRRNSSIKSKKRKQSRNIPSSKIGARNRISKKIKKTKDLNKKHKRFE